MSRITRTGNALLPGGTFDPHALLPPQEAVDLYLSRAHLRPPAIEHVALEHAFGRILAQDVIADSDVPPIARSAMDGFAVRSSELPGRLHIAGEIRMGEVWKDEFPANSALRIPTGGALPAQADAVVPFEDVHEEAGFIEVARVVPAGDAVNPAAGDVRAAEVVLQSGRCIGAAELGVLATLGIAAPPTFARPTVAVVSGGDELVGVTERPGPAQVRDSNRWSVAGALQALGAQVRHLPIAADDCDRLENVLREALARADAVVMTGGSSVGRRDVTPAAIGALGEPGVLVHGLRVRPGKPTVLAAIDGKALIGLPGNPTSALMILTAVAAPIVSALTGRRERSFGIRARLKQAYRKRPGWTWLVLVRLEGDGAELAAHPLEMHSSMVSLPARADGYLNLGEEIESMQAGEYVSVQRFL